MDIITSTKGYKNNTLEPLTKNLINKYIQYKSNVLSTFSWLEPVLTPALDIGIAKSGSNLVHSHPSHILCLTPCVKARKSFHGVLPCLVMMYHQTNLDCKSFSISEDLVEMIVALTLKIAKYFWMIVWLMMMHHHTKFDRREILSGQTFIEVQNLHCDLDLEYSKATFSHSHIWLYEPKSCYCDLDFEDRNLFFAYNALAYNDVSPNGSAMHKISSKLTLTETFNLGCDIDLEHSNPTFSLDTSLLIMIYTDIEFVCKRLTGLELIKDVVETVIFWLYKPTLWPWPWR